LFNESCWKWSCCGWGTCTSFSFYLQPLYVSCYHLSAKRQGSLYNLKVRLNSACIHYKFTQVDCMRFKLKTCSHPSRLIRAQSFLSRMQLYSQWFHNVYLYCFYVVLKSNIYMEHLSHFFIVFLIFSNNISFSLQVVHISHNDVASSKKWKLYWTSWCFKRITWISPSSWAYHLEGWCIYNPLILPSYVDFSQDGYGCSSLYLFPGPWWSCLHEVRILNIITSCLVQVHFAVWFFSLGNEWIVVWGSKILRIHT
jgi:hypothetical protein